MELPAYVDDQTIPDHAELWRRIHPNQFVLDKNSGQRRPSSAAFGDSSDQSSMSVYIGEEVRKSGREPVALLQGHEGFGLASITAGLARRCNQGIVRDPLPQEPAHGLIFGPKTPRIRRELARNSEWVIFPEGLNRV